MTSLREFKAAARAAVLSLPPAPEGFGFDDLAGRLGEPHRDQTRLRRFIQNRIADGALLRLGRGRYAAGKRLAEENALGVGVELVSDIHAAFFDHGGVISMAALLKELGRTGAYDATHVRTVLQASPLYRSGLPFAGHRRDWFMIDSERLKVPVPGRLLGLEVQMVAGGRDPAEFPHRLRHRRGLVGAALAEARGVNGHDADTVTAIPAVANALELALQGSDIPHRVGGSSAPLSAWWAQRNEDAGRARALAEAWALLETEGAHHLIATTVRFWSAVGEALGFSAPHLSRGCVARLR